MNSYDYIVAKGVLAALGDRLSIYTPPYTYLLALLTLTYPFVPKMIAIKLLSILADAINAFLVYRIVQLKYPGRTVALHAAGAFLCLPTVFTNSAVWGQVDALYMVFLLTSLYYLLKARAFHGMLAFSVAFAFKAQAIFLAPFLVILAFKHRIRPWHFVLIPAVYVLLCLPVVVLGRDWMDVLFIYLNQGTVFHFLSANAPNLYGFLPHRYYQAGLWIGGVVTLLATGLWIILTLRTESSVKQERLVLLALVSVALVPFLLPKMHDRYFYPADVISLILAFFTPQLWFVPLAFQAASGLAYTSYLMHAPVTNVHIAAAITTVTVIYLLLVQFRSARLRADDPGRRINV